MNNAVWFMSGVIASFFVLLIAVLIEECIENCGRKRIERVADEFAKKMEEMDDEHQRRLEQEAKSREFLIAKHDDDIIKCAEESRKAGIEEGRKMIMDAFTAKVRSGEITINKVDKH